jgi:hypothetical protein
MGSINFAEPPTLDEIDERIVALLKRTAAATSGCAEAQIAAATVTPASGG